MIKRCSLFFISYLLISSCFLCADPLDKETTITITAKQFEVKGDKKLAIATGDVQVARGPLLITGDLANYFETTQEIQLTGQKKPVWFQYREIQGMCGKALYRIREKKIVTTENPIVTRGKDRLEGDRIEFHLTGQRLMIGGNSKVKLNEGPLDRE